MSALDENSRPKGKGALPAAGRAARFLTTAVPLAVAIAFLIAGAVGAETLKGVIDGVTPDGSAGRLPLERIGPFQQRLLVAGGVWLVLAVLTFVPRLRVTDVAVAGVRSLPALFRQAGRGLAGFVRAEPAHALFLGFLVALSVGLALFGLQQPVRCDEALTAMQFAPRNPLFIACSYGDSNNHILHSLAVSLSWRLFGHELWALRLPALVAGALLAPVTYAMVRALFSRPAALVAAAMVATSPFVLDLATNSRGYSLVNLLFVALLAISPRLVASSAITGWVAFVLLAVAGFYTVPTMAYPFAIVVGWLLLSALVDLPRAEWRPFLLRLGTAVSAVVALTLVLYSPTFLVDGPETLLKQKWVQPSIPVPTDEPPDVRTNQPHTYLAFAIQWVNKVYRGWKQIWMYGDLYAAATLALLAFPVGCLVRRRFSHGMRLLVAAALCSLVLVLFFASLPPTRSISFFLPMGAAVAAAGFVFLLRLATRGRDSWVATGAWAAAAVVLVLNARVVYDLRDEHAFLPWYVGYYDAEQAVAALEDVLQPQDRIIGEPTELPPVEFYIDRLEALRIHGLWVTGAYWAGVARHEQEIDNLYLIEPQIRTPERGGVLPLWREWRHDALRERMESAGYERTDEVIELPTSRIVRYTLTPGH